MQLKCPKDDKTGAGEMAQWAESLLWSMKTQVRIPSTLQKPGIDVLACNFSDGQWRQVDLWPTSPEEMVNFRLSERACLNK